MYIICNTVLKTTDEINVSLNYNVNLACINIVQLFVNKNMYFQ